MNSARRRVDGKGRQTRVGRYTCTHKYIVYNIILYVEWIEREREEKATGWQKGAGKERESERKRVRERLKEGRESDRERERERMCLLMTHMR